MAPKPRPALPGYPVTPQENVFDVPPAEKLPAVKPPKPTAVAPYVHPANRQNPEA